MTRSPEDAPLRRNPNFLLLVAGQLVSLFGSAISLIAIPLTAVLVIHASALETSIISALGAVSWFVLGLPAGLVLDRVRRRPVLILADLMRGAVLLAIPGSLAVGGLSLGLIYVVSLVVGSGSVFFEIGYQSYLPTLVSRAKLVRANSWIAATYTLSMVVGPAVGGALIAALTAPVVIAGDAVSFFVSAISLALIQKQEPRAPTDHRSTRVFAGLAEGWGFVWREGALKTILVSNTAFFFAYGMIGGILIVFQSRYLGLSPFGIGIVAASAGVGGTIGTIASTPIIERLSLPVAIRVSALGRGLFWVGLPLTLLAPHWSVEVLSAVQVASSLSWSVFSVGQLAYRQQLVRDDLLSRVTSVNNLLTRGGGPLGALVGGILAQALDVPRAVTIGAFAAGAAGFLALMPLRR